MIGTNATIAGTRSPGLFGGGPVSVAVSTSRTTGRATYAAATTTKGLAALRWHRRAVAAVEFALIAPVLAVVLVGAIDYGFAEWSRSCLANAVAQGAYYAFLTGPSVSPTAVQSVVQNASSLNGISTNGVPTIACYCPSGSPASLGTSVSTTLPCTSTCPDGTRAGAYIVISASYTLAPWIPIPYYSALSGQSITETVQARLQ